MIRKVSNIILAIVLLVSTTGFSLSKHYCGDEVISIEVNTESASCCDSPDCCHTETQFNKLDVEFIVSVSSEKIDENKSYYQFDLFEYAVSYVENSSPYQEIESYLKIPIQGIYSFQHLFQNFRL